MIDFPADPSAPNPVCIAGVWDASGAQWATCGRDCFDNASMCPDHHDQARAGATEHARKYLGDTQRHEWGLR